MTWRLARALETLRAQVNTRFPNRSKESDGSIGDEAHASRSSDHNPWVKDGETGIVTAIDITHDPKGGFDSYAFADMLLAKQDSRLKYVISNRRIGSGPAGPQPGVWRKYTGSNPHDHHCHISVMSDKARYDAIKAWNLDGISEASPEVAAAHVPPPATVRFGSTGEPVKQLQTALGVIVTGAYEPKSETEYALRLYQVRHNLDPDGVCGPMTWGLLKPAA